MAEIPDARLVIIKFRTNLISTKSIILLYECKRQNPYQKNLISHLSVKWQQEFTPFAPSRVAVSFLETPSNTTQQLLSGVLSTFNDFRSTWKAHPPKSVRTSKTTSPLFHFFCYRKCHTFRKFLSLKNLQPKNMLNKKPSNLSFPPFFPQKSCFSASKTPLPNPTPRFAFSIRSSRTPSSKLDRHGTTTLQLRPWTLSLLARCWRLEGRCPW